MNVQNPEESSARPPTIPDLTELRHARASVTLDRSVPNSETTDLQLRSFADMVTGVLKNDLEDLNADNDASGPSLALQAVGSSYTTTVQDAIERLQEPIRITVNDRCRIVAPPYDVDWSSGGGLSFLSRYDGEVACIGQEGFSAAGVGLYLAANKVQDVSITPSGTYTFACMAIKPDVHDFRSRGGLGITIYQAGNHAPAYSRQVQLWNVRGTTLTASPNPQLGKIGQGASGSGSIATASSPGAPGGFGTYPLAPLFVSLHPGVQSLVWVWAWNVTIGAEDVFSLIYMKTPAVTVCSVPPLVIH